jgi:hypothetical protein
MKLVAPELGVAICPDQLVDSAGYDRPATWGWGAEMK